MVINVGVENVPCHQTYRMYIAGIVAVNLLVDYRCTGSTRQSILMHRQDNVTLSRLSYYIDGFVQDCSIPSTLSMEILQSCTMVIVIVMYPFAPMICISINEPTYKTNTHCQSSFVFINMVNTWRPRQNGRHFADDTFKCIFMNENVRISINISLKFVPKSLINNIPALV